MSDKPTCACTEDSPCVAHAVASKHGERLRILAQMESDQRVAIDGMLADCEWPIYINNAAAAQKFSDYLYEKGVRIK